GQPAGPVAVLGDDGPAPPAPALAGEPRRGSIRSGSPSTASPTAASRRCASRRSWSGYCLSICSSDFSDWIWRTVSSRHANGYLAHNEYEIFEFDLGSTFNYGEIAALICPRPFMAEQFHRDGLVANMDAAEFGRAQLPYE